MTAQTAVRTRAIPTNRASLSWVPKVDTAKFFSQGGVRSTNAPPTAITGDGVPEASPVVAISPARSVATPSVRAPATMPTRADQDRFIRSACHAAV
jgi:hypothetical protein